MVEQQQVVPNVQINKDFAGKPNNKPILETEEVTTVAFFIVMEYCEKGDLVDCQMLFKNNPAIIRSIYSGILEGIRFMHDDCKVAHLDIKPGNVLIDRNNIPKIIDFATVCQIEVPQTMKVGTKSHIAPEIYLAFNNAADENHPSYKGGPADIYSLGITLHQMHFGATPVETSEW